MAMVGELKRYPCPSAPGPCNCTGACLRPPAIGVWGNNRHGTFAPPGEDSDDYIRIVYGDAMRPEDV